MRILGIETSCDETAASVVEVGKDKNHITLLSSVTATSLTLHAKTGGIIPEVAARNQVKDIIPVIYEALTLADGVWPMARGKKTHELLSINNKPAIDKIAITYGPGLIGSLLVGVETAKALSYIWDIPLIPVNHLFGHIYANWIDTSPEKKATQASVNQTKELKIKRLNSENRKQITDNRSLFTSPSLPAIALIVSGGHTDLIFMKSHEDIIWLGGTRDDAAGEAFDKIGRMLGLAYPAGPVIEKLAKNGNPKAFHFPRPLMYDKAFDFSFSGLKTAVLREIQKIEKNNRTQHTIVPQELEQKADCLIDKRKRQSPVSRKNLYPCEEKTYAIPIKPAEIADICHCAQDAIIDVLVYKTLQAAKKYRTKSIILGGGVAANETLREAFQKMLTGNNQQSTIKFFVPPKNLCTDNGSMIAAAAIFQGKEKDWKETTADPELYFD